MRKAHYFRILTVGILTLLTGSVSANASGQLPVPRQVAVQGSKAQTAASILAARGYAACCNTGDETYAKAALSHDFMDRTLPAGRVQGIEGPLLASKAFRTEVPDLRVEIVQLVVAGDRISVQYQFKGHLSGSAGGVAGQVQRIEFSAFDIYRAHAGRIAENWHLEDNLELMKQLGISSSLLACP